MAKPTAITEAGTAKVMLLADSNVTTPGANTPASIIQGTSGEATYPVGWQGVATHRAGDTKLTPGGFTMASAPMAAVGGFDASAAGTARPLLTDESGVLLVRPQYAHNLPIAQANGGVSVSAAAETPITTAVALYHQYLLRLTATCIGTVLGGAVNGGSWSLKNGTGGTVIGYLPQPYGSPSLGQQFVWEFPVPHKTSSTAQAFTITPSSTFLGTWLFMANGYRSVL